MASIPDNDTFLRHVGASKIDGARVDGAAFRREKKDVDGVSGNWPEFFKGLNLAEALVEIRKAFAAKGRNIGPKSQSKFAQVSVGKTKAYISEKANRKIDFVHAQEEADPSHAIIIGYEINDVIIADMIALWCVQALLPGRE